MWKGVEEVLLQEDFDTKRAVGAADSKEQSKFGGDLEAEAQGPCQPIVDPEDKASAAEQCTVQVDIGPELQKHGESSCEIERPVQGQRNPQRKDAEVAVDVHSKVEEDSVVDAGDEAILQDGQRKSNSESTAASKVTKAEMGLDGEGASTTGTTDVCVCFGGDGCRSETEGQQKDKQQRASTRSLEHEYNLFCLVKQDYFFFMTRRR